MMNDNRIGYYAPADYTEDSELDNLVKAIIDKTAANEVLVDKHMTDLSEAKAVNKADDVGRIMKMLGVEV